VLLRPLLAALAVAACALPAPALSDWSAFHNDERNSGFVASSDYQVYTDVWWNVKLTPATQVDSSPVVAGSVAVITSWDKKIRAFDAESGAELWNQSMSARSRARP